MTEWQAWIKIPSQNFKVILKGCWALKVVQDECAMYSYVPHLL